MVFSTEYHATVSKSSNRKPENCSLEFGLHVIWSVFYKRGYARRTRCYCSLITIVGEERDECTAHRTLFLYRPRILVACFSLKWHLEWCFEQVRLSDSGKCRCWLLDCPACSTISITATLSLVNVFEPAHKSLLSERYSRPTLVWQNRRYGPGYPRRVN